MISRGDVVLVHIPYVESAGLGKNRPALVVQGDAHNQNRPHTIVASITSKLRNSVDPSVLLLDPADSEGQAAGVLMKSLIRCDRLFTVDQNSIVRRIGHLAPGTMDRVEDCLRASLGLPPQAQPFMGNYEKWPGFLELRERLQMFSSVLKLNVTGHACMSVEIQVMKLAPIVELAGTDLQVIPPTTKEEFKETGYSVRLTFRIADEESLAKARQLAPTELEKYAIHRATLWAHSGKSNTILAAYTSQCLNEGSLEVYVLSLPDGVFEVGFNSNGNLFDALLLSDRLHLVKLETDEIGGTGSPSNPNPA